MKKHETLLFIAACMALVMLAAAPASADNVIFYPFQTTFQVDDIVHWNQLGVNATVPNNFSATSDGGIGVTGVFAKGGSGLTQLECPEVGCTWNGNFAPGATVLFTNDPGQGPLELSFSQGVAGIGFQIQPDNFDANFVAEIQAFNGSTPLDPAFFRFGASNSQNDNTAEFLGIEDLTAPNITSFKVTTFLCSAPGVCQTPEPSFAINEVLLQTEPVTPTPEPGSLFLVGSGLLGALGFLRRRLVPQN
jgi:PEP-CTERM motif